MAVLYGMLTIQYSVKKRF